MCSLNKVVCYVHALYSIVNFDNIIRYMYMYVQNASWLHHSATEKLSKEVAIVLDCE